MTQIKNNNLKFIKMKKYIIIISLLFFTLGSKAQETLDAQQRIKVDGIAVVVGKNIVLNSDIDKFKKELEQRVEGKIEISDCEMLEEIMIQKLIAHHAVVDSIVVTDAEINSEVERIISNFTQQLGSMDKVIEFYG